MKNYGVKKFLFIACLGLFVSCTPSDGPAPKNQDNACSILEQRRGWLSDMRTSERKWGVPVHVQMAIIWKESSFRQHARPRKEATGSSSKGELRSSAYGYSQALDGTWEWYQKDTGQYRRKRHDFGDASDFVGWYGNQSLKRSGIAKTDAYNLYLSYHQGHGGFNRGSYRNQSWLLSVARQVRNRAALYRSQLPYCTRV